MAIAFQPRLGIVQPEGGRIEEPSEVVPAEEQGRSKRGTTQTFQPTLRGDLVLFQRVSCAQDPLPQASPAEIEKNKAYWQRFQRKQVGPGLLEEPQTEAEESASSDGGAEPEPEADDSDSTFTEHGGDAERPHEVKMEECEAASTGSAMDQDDVASDPEPEASRPPLRKMERHVEPSDSESESDVSSEECRQRAMKEALEAETLIMGDVSPKSVFRL